MSRVLLKLSGESFADDETNFGIESSTLTRIADEIARASNDGIEIGVVVGGGNFFRGVSESAKNMAQANADYMGMLATVINAIALKDALDKKGINTRVQSAITMTSVAEPYIRLRAIRHLEKGRVVIFASGTGNPYFTTDSAAVLRAIEINAEVILKGTRVDGIYNEDPEVNKEAIKFDNISFEETIKKGLKIMDTTAFTLSKENELPIIVFDMNTRGNLTKVIMGEKIGTKVSK